jgi:hypothetical protein
MYLLPDVFHADQRHSFLSINIHAASISIVKLRRVRGDSLVASVSVEHSSSVSACSIECDLLFTENGVTIPVLCRIMKQ